MRTADTSGHSRSAIASRARRRHGTAKCLYSSRKTSQTGIARLLGTQAANIDGVSQHCPPHRSIAMFADSNPRNVFQRATCMLLSILIVGASLGIGMLG